MNKKLIAVILAVVLISGAVMLISGCNKDDETTIQPNESTDTIIENEPDDEEPSVEEPEISSGDKESESTSGEKETEKQTEKESEAKEPTPSQTEKPTQNEKNDICEVCGGIIVDNSDTDLPLVGNYCDGMCDEWFGEVEV